MGRFLLYVSRQYLFCGNYDKSKTKEKKVADDIRKFPSFLSHVCLKYRMKVQLYTGVISGFRRGLNYIFDLLGCYAMYRLSIKSYPDYTHLLQENYLG